MRKLYYLAVMIFFISCTSSTASDPETSKPAKTKTSVNEKESRNPLNYLVQEKFTSRRNFIHQWVLQGKILNKATTVSYRDVAINITYHDKKGVQIGKTERTILKLFQPGSSQNFQFKTEGPEGTASVRYKITGATVVK